MEAFVLQRLWPVITNASPSRTARVCIEPGSEPTFGSVRAKQPTASAVASRGSQRRFCSSEP